MEKCLICNQEFITTRSLGSHMRKHKITMRQYREKFNLLCYCPSCGKEIYCGNLTGFCNSCRDRSGENNPFFNKKHKKETIIKKRCSENSKLLWKNKEYREKVIKNSSKPRNKNFSREQSIRVKEWYNKNPEQKEIRSTNMKKYWKDGTILKNNYSSNSSNLEKELFQLAKSINKNFQNKFTLKIKNKWFFPDIIDLKRKLIIEFYGDFYHCNPKQYKPDYKIYDLKAIDVWNHDKNRINKFINSGYKVLIIWEDDFKNNLEIVINKIKTTLNKTESLY